MKDNCDSNIELSLLPESDTSYYFKILNTVAFLASDFFCKIFKNKKKVRHTVSETTNPPTWLLWVRGQTCDDLHIAKLLETSFFISIFWLFDIFSKWKINLYDQVPTVSGVNDSFLWKSIHQWCISAVREMNHAIICCDNNTIIFTHPLLYSRKSFSIVGSLGFTPLAHKSNALIWLNVQLSVGVKSPASGVL